MPGADELKSYYELEVDPKYLLKYEKEIVARSKLIFKWAKRYGNVKRVLDVGCGLGLFLSLAKGEGWQALGTELSKEAAEHAKKHYGAEVLAGELMNLDLEKESFDLVSMQHVFEHVLEPRQVLEYAHSILRKNGLLVIAVPNAESLIAKLAGTNWLCLSEKSHLFHYSRDNLARILEECGFIVKESTTLQVNKRDLLWGLRQFIFGRGARSSPADLIRSIGQGSEILVLAQKDLRK
jgi:2-polyprenyl-3-methyl-5-hydroxy-6-metoxy-1,4-benzoquinol methylase